MCEIQWIIGALSFVSLVGVFYKMEHGFGPNNLKALGIVIVAVFVAVLATINTTAFTAAFGIFGTMAGYFFRVANEKKDGQDLKKQ